VTPVSDGADRRQGALVLSRAFRPFDQSVPTRVTESRAKITVEGSGAHSISLVFCGPEAIHKVYTIHNEGKCFFTALLFATLIIKLFRRESKRSEAGSLRYAVLSPPML
jgi:hypothetical protein